MATVQDLPTIEALSDARQSVRAELARLQRRLRRQLALESIVDAVVVLTALGAALVVLDWRLRLSVDARGAILSMAGAGALAFLGIRFFRRSRSSRLDELSLAMVLDRHRPGTGQRVTDVLQLLNLLDEGPDDATAPSGPGASGRASPALVRLAVGQSLDALRGSDWRRLWNWKRTLARALFGIAVALVPTCFGLWAPRAARLSVARWIWGSSERWPQHTYLSVMGLNADGRLLAPRDERFTMEVRSDLPLLERKGDRWLIGGRGRPLTLRWGPTSAAPRSVFLREHLPRGQSREGALVAAGPSRFHFDFAPASTSTTFDLTGGDDWLGPIRIERVDRPALAAIKARVQEPGDRTPGFRDVADARGHLAFLPDTQIELTLVGSEPIADAQFKVPPESGEPPELKRIDDRTFAAHWSLRKAMTLETRLKSAKTGLDSVPSFLSFGLKQDREPRVSLRATGVGGHVTAVATIPLTIGATDDLGISALRLQVERSRIVETKDASKPDSKRQTIALPLATGPDRPVLDHQTRYALVLAADKPAVGTMVRLVAEADDRCAQGAQTGRSGPLQFQVVSPEDLFYEILLKQRAERARFLGAIASMDQQTPVLDGAPSAKEAVAVLRVARSSARTVEQVAGRIDDALQEMTLNQIGSTKSHRLLREGVIGPLRALAAGPMNELHEALRALAAASAAGGDGAGPAIENARRSHKQVVAKMKDILEQMSQWESFVDVVNQVAEVIRMQQGVLKDTRKAQETRAKEIFDEQP